MSVSLPPLRSGVEKIRPYEPGKPIEEVERELGVARASKLASNENPLGPSPRVRRALSRATGALNRYPDGSCFYLRQALSRHLRVRPEELIIGNGSNELLVLLGLAYLRPREEVLTSQMTFVVYGLVANLMNAKFITVPMQKYTYDLEAMARALTPKTRMVFIANPNNPTGTLLPSRALASFIRRVPRKCLVVLDEAYHEYVEPRARAHSLSWVRQYPNVAVLRTFSKAYALAGLRLGYGVVSPEVKAAVDRVRDPFNVNSLAQVAAQAALQDGAYMKKCVALAKSERRRVGRELLNLGIKVVPSQTNFLFVELPEQVRNSQVFHQSLLQLGVIIRPFPGQYARITLGKPSENDKLLRSVKKVLNYPALNR